MTSDFPQLSGDVPRLQSYGLSIFQLVRFARCCTSISDFHSKNLQFTSKLLTKGYRYHKLRKTFGKFFMSYSNLLSKLVKYRFENMFRKESLSRFSTMIYSTNSGGSNVKRISSDVFIYFIYCLCSSNIPRYFLDFALSPYMCMQ